MAVGENFGNAGRLFVDCDDTLVRWLDPLEGRLTTEWEPNAAVVAFVELWVKDHPRGKLIVWSTGGSRYAARWGELILPHLKWQSESKRPHVPIPGDLFLDDDPLPSFAEATLHPRTLGVLP